MQKHSEKNERQKRKNNQWERGGREEVRGRAGEQGKMLWTAMKHNNLWHNHTFLVNKATFANVLSIGLPMENYLPFFPSGNFPWWHSSPSLQKHGISCWNHLNTMEVGKRAPQINRECLERVHLSSKWTLLLRGLNYQNQVTPGDKICWWRCNHVWASWTA